MLPTISSRALREEVHSFLWRQWTQLGVSGNIDFLDRWVIDPEALLLGTLDLARREPRLYDEVLDWCVLHGQRLSVQRLKTMRRAEETSDDSRRALSAIASLLSEASGPRWRTLVDAANPDQCRPLFHKMNGEPIAMWGEPEQHFSEAGRIRKPFELRGLSGPIPMDTPACLLLRLRTLFGLSPRAEVVAFLIARGQSTASEAARQAGYTIPSAASALSELADGQFISRIPRQSYRLDLVHWAEFLGQDAEQSPAWIRWPNVFAALSQSLATIEEIESGHVTQYVAQSALLRLHDSIRELLGGSGIAGLDFPPSKHVSAHVAVQNAIGSLLKSLNGA